MASARRKSAAIALAVVGVAGLSLASAAQLNVTTSSLGAGTALVASCDDAIGADFTTSLSGTTYTTTALVLTDVAAACDGQAYGVQLLTGAAGAQTPLGSEITGADLDVVDGAVTLPVSQATAAITGVSVVIHS